MAEAMKPGTFVWHEVATPERSKGGPFYTKLFGWGTREMEMGPGGTYTIFTQDGADIGGMVEMKGEQWEGVPPHWMLYIAVDDVDASAKEVETLGGKVMTQPFDIPEVGRIAVVQDPAGAVFSLFKGAS